MADREVLCVSDELKAQSELLKRLVRSVSELEARIGRLEAAFYQHSKLGDYCPHTTV